ncbi:hypothetical protein HN587_02760 [Candidatus Woesearchaeota archaeon]|jgi:hypothetical protein|nr:hypothetical protein [Candidatus Woesearchaeota archaeon]
MTAIVKLSPLRLVSEDKLTPEDELAIIGKVISKDSGKSDDLREGSNLVNLVNSLNQVYSPEIVTGAVEEFFQERDDRIENVLASRVLELESKLFETYEHLRYVEGMSFQLRYVYDSKKVFKDNKFMEVEKFIEYSVQINKGKLIIKISNNYPSQRTVVNYGQKCYYEPKAHLDRLVSISVSEKKGMPVINWRKNLDSWFSKKYSTSEFLINYAARLTESEKTKEAFALAAKYLGTALDDMVKKTKQNMSAL